MAIQLPVIKTRVREDPLVRRTLRVGALARLSGKTVRALHLYEEMGLLVPVERSKGGYRLVRRATRSRACAGSPSCRRWASRSATSRRWRGSGSRAARRRARWRKVERLLTEKLADTREQIARLQQLETELQASLDYLRTCPTCDPNQIIEACAAASCTPRPNTRPELVAGFSAH